LKLRLYNTTQDLLMDLCGSMYKALKNRLNFIGQ
jgi:hypothetical protein